MTTTTIRRPLTVDLCSTVCTHLCLAAWHPIVRTIIFWSICLLCHPVGAQLGSAQRRRKARSSSQILDVNFANKKICFLEGLCVSNARKLRLIELRYGVFGGAAVEASGSVCEKLLDDAAPRTRLGRPRRQLLRSKDAFHRRMCLADLEADDGKSEEGVARGALSASDLIR